MPKLLLVLLLLKEEEGGAEVLVSVSVVAHRPVNLHKRGRNHTGVTFILSGKLCP